MANIPFIFKSDDVYKHLPLADKYIDYNKLLNSESVKISSVQDSAKKDTQIFDISVSYPDHDIAAMIGKTLIDAFESSNIHKGKTILNAILSRIEQDKEELGLKNIIIEDTVLINLDAESDSLYKELNKYIVDYNVGLYDELEKNKKAENVSFYNILIPPNDISDKISKIKNEIELYRQKILENQTNIIILDDLKERLIRDEDAILSRIALISENPLYQTPGNRLRDLAIVVILSLLAGAAVVFIVNYASNIKKDKLPNK